MSQRNRLLVPKIDSCQEIREIAEKCLRRAGALGKIPTPIGDLLAAANVVEEKDSDNLLRRFLSSLPQNIHSAYHFLGQKIRGIADLRERVIYVPNPNSKPRELFTKCHELGQQVLPWQNLENIHGDNDFSLSPYAQKFFDLEANYFAGEAIFQGLRFQTRVRDYHPSISAVSLLADEHGASRHATFHRFVEEHDEPLAFMPYWPNEKELDPLGFPALFRGKAVLSPRFLKKYGDVEFPSKLQSDNPVSEARFSIEICSGDISLDSTGGKVNLQWESWWNQYSLLVLFRKKPPLSFVSHIIR
jgi:hypothetical protein